MKRFIIGFVIVACVVPFLISDNKTEKYSYTEKELKSNTAIFTNDESIATENDCLKHLEDINTKINDKISSIDFNKYKDNFISASITFIDFLFYDGEIGGYTFKELSDEGKEKALDIYNKIDTKIEDKFPNYKDNIKSTTTKTYNKVGDLIKEAEESLKQKIDASKGEGTYESTKEKFIEGFEEETNKVKEQIKDIYEEVKDSELSKSAKEGYDQAKENIYNWYQELKDKYN